MIWCGLGKLIDCMWKHIIMALYRQYRYRVAYEIREREAYEVVCLGELTGSCFITDAD